MMEEPPGPTVICAWCRRTIRRGTPLLSHGICSRCMLKFRRESRAEVRGRPIRPPYRFPGRGRLTSAD